MIIEVETNGARVVISGENLSVLVVDAKTGNVKSGFNPDDAARRRSPRSETRRIFNEVFKEHLSRSASEEARS